VINIEKKSTQQTQFTISEMCTVCTNKTIKTNKILFYITGQAEQELY